MSLFAKAKKARENKKGFTLVELIVVLVILAILAAILVPALLGWIDEARNKQYVLEARSVYMAAQAVADEEYAKGSIGSSETLIDKIGGTGSDAAGATAKEKNVHRIETLADVTGLNIVGIGTTGSSLTTDPHGMYEINTMRIQFKSGDTYVGATLDKGTWTVNTSTTGAIDPPATEAAAG